MLAVVPDVNVLVSALINQNGPPGRIQAAWQRGELEFVTSGVIIAKTEEVLRRPSLTELLSVVFPGGEHEARIQRFVRASPSWRQPPSWTITAFSEPVNLRGLVEHERAAVGAGRRLGVRPSVRCRGDGGGPIAAVQFAAAEARGTASLHAAFQVACPGSGEACRQHSHW